MSIAHTVPTRRRFLEHAGTKQAKHRNHGLKDDHPAVVEGRTLFPSRVVSPDSVVNVLKSGAHSRKIGPRVTKGKWRGFPIFTLTLEERKTCPRTCQHWNDCYGTGMPFPHRYAHGPELIAKLDGELAALQSRFPDGYVVRLHILGDFYSLGYVETWFDWLDEFPALHIFGYTAWPVTTPIGRAIQFVRDRFFERFAVRTSDGGLKDGSTISLTPADAGKRGKIAGGYICPAQTKQTDCCATCGICWASRVNIAFHAH